MTVLAEYIGKDRARLDFEHDTPEHDLLLEEMDDLWWKMTDSEQKISEKCGEGKWIKVGDKIVCPMCGNKVESSGLPVRCMACMHDLAPGVVECS